MATIIAVPLANFDRASVTVVKRGQESGASFWLNMEDCMKARATCVISATKPSSGTMLCWLVRRLETVVLEEEDIYPVKYMTYLALADEAAAKIKKEIGNNMASISFPLGEI
jgi:hypothetical protein